MDSYEYQYKNVHDFLLTKRPIPYHNILSTFLRAAMCKFKINYDQLPKCTSEGQQLSCVVVNPGRTYTEAVYELKIDDTVVRVQQPTDFVPLFFANINGQDVLLVHSELTAENMLQYIKQLVSIR